MTTRIAIRFEDDTAKKLRGYAEDFGVSLNWVVSQAVDQWLNMRLITFTTPPLDQVEWTAAHVITEEGSMTIPLGDHSFSQNLTDEEVAQAKAEIEVTVAAPCEHADTEKTKLGFPQCKACGQIKGKDGEWRG